MVDSHTSRRVSVHQALGGGSMADLLLRRKRGGSFVVLVAATWFWFLFEKAGYNVLTFTANVLLLLVVILFFWAKSAALLNRPLPPIPDLEISEELVEKAADEMRVRVNHVLSIAREIAIGGNLRVFFQVAITLWWVSYIGSFCNFLTFVYIGILLSFTVPILYEKFQGEVDDKLSLALKVIQARYRRVDETVSRELPSCVYITKQKTQ
ncbi:Reticulon-like protein [Drosera capensis]